MQQMSDEQREELMQTKRMERNQKAKERREQRKRQRGPTQRFCDT